SSRRRHTRFSRDWSSDVCSSDLPREQSGFETAANAYRRARGLDDVDDDVSLGFAGPAAGKSDTDPAEHAHLDEPHPAVIDQCRPGGLTGLQTELVEDGCRRHALVADDGGGRDDHLGPFGDPDVEGDVSAVLTE